MLGRRRATIGPIPPSDPRMTARKLPAAAAATAAEIRSPGTAPRDDARAYRSALGHYPTGVTIVTTRRAGGEPVGLTANSFSSVSLDPPLVLWSLARRSGSLEAFEGSSHYAINILASDQRHLSQRFATPSLEKYEGVQWTPGPGGAPLIGGAAVQLVCANYRRMEGGDHVIFLGEVLEFVVAGRPPLIFCQGRYVMTPAELDPTASPP